MERKAGHFASPLFIWMDESLRTPATYRPRTVSAIASQVDVAPTLLALNGILPAVGAFAGHDLTCLLVRDCLQDQVAYLTSVYDNLVGLASPDRVVSRGHAQFRRGIRQRVGPATTVRYSRPGVDGSLRGGECRARFESPLVLARVRDTIMIVWGTISCSSLFEKDLLL